MDGEAIYFQLHQTSRGEVLKVSVYEPGIRGRAVTSKGMFTLESLLVHEPEL